MRSRALLCFALVAALPSGALAQGSPASQRSHGRDRDEKASPIGVSHTRDLRDHFGFAMAKRLLESTDSATRRRGIERAASVGSPEAVALLVKLADPMSTAHADPREAIELVRALAQFSDQAPARKALGVFVTMAMSSGGATSRDHLAGADDADPTARFEFARQMAALALARSGDAATLVKPLVEAVRLGSVGDEACREALLASSFPPNFTIAPLSSASAIELARAVGDTRVTPTLRNAAHSTDSSVRAAAVEALAELGDAPSIAIAREALADKSPRVRIAGAHALAIYNAPEQTKAVAALIDDDATLAAGVALAERTQNAAITKALAARLATSSSIDLRRAILTALGRADSIDALRVLAAFVKDPDVGADAARAIAASPNAEATRVVEKMIADKTTSRLGVRAYVVRRASTGEKSSFADDAIDAFAKSRDGGARALGILARLLLGRGDPGESINDADPRVRRAASLAMLDERYANSRKILLDRLPHERDEAVRELAAIALLDPSARGRMPTLALEDRATSGSADAPLATLARAARKTEGGDAVVAAALSSADAVTRVHAALGLGESSAPDATGMLAAAYAYEADPFVRRAIVVAIAEAAPSDSVSRLSTLRLAANLDPDREARMTAERALQSLPPAASAAVTNIAWIHLETNDGKKPPPAMLAAVIRSDGLAVPIVFDDDGFALVPGVPSGDARLVLAPRLPTDKDIAR